MVLTEYNIICKQITAPLRIALAADLHNHFPGEITDALRNNAPDLILIPGDLLDDETIEKAPENALRFLKTCASIAPTFYSLGNHEIACYHRGNPLRHPIPKPLPESFRSAVKETGVVLLEDESVQWNEISICGLTSGIHGKDNRPDASTLSRFSELKGIRILLCHHPEYFYPYLQKMNFELVVSGHAHGGHWRLFGHGIYAPGQGLFPRATSGVLDDTCVISRGLGDHTKIPRIFNPHELVFISLTSK